MKTIMTGDQARAVLKGTGELINATIIVAKTIDFSMSEQGWKIRDCRFVAKVFSPRPDPFIEFS